CGLQRLDVLVGTTLIGDAIAFDGVTIQVTHVDMLFLNIRTSQQIGYHISKLPWFFATTIGQELKPEFRVHADVVKRSCSSRRSTWANWRRVLILEPVALPTIANNPRADVPENHIRVCDNELTRVIECDPW